MIWSAHMKSQKWGMMLLKTNVFFWLKAFQNQSKYKNV